MQQLDKQPVKATRNASGKGNKTITTRAIIPLLIIVFVAGSVVGAFLARRQYQAKLVIASVNGKNIDESALFFRMQETAGSTTMHTLVEEELRKQFAASLGLAPTDAEIDAQIASLQKQPNFQETLAASGQTLDGIRHTVALQLAQAKVFANGVQASDADVRGFYQINTSPANPQAIYYKAATAKIQAVICRSHDKIAAASAELTNGIPFDQVAQKYSEDPSGKTGGVFPVIVRGRSKLSAIAGFESSVFGLRIGEQSQPIKIGGAWWIIRCNDKAPAETTPFQEVRSECEFDARVAKGIKLHGKDVEEQFKKFQDRASIQAFWPQYQNAVKP